MTRKIALLSDIHGNLTALKAVLADAKKEKVTDYWILGDVVMQGPASSAIFEQIEALKPEIWLKGNWDELLLCTADRTGIELDNATDIYIARLAMDILKRTTTQQLATLRALPLHQTTVVNGVAISLSHHLPNKNWGRELVPAQVQENFDQLFLTDDIDVAIYGHTHVQLMRYSSTGQLILNPGSVGNPFYQRTQMRHAVRADYALLEIDSQGMIQVSFKRVPYDAETEIKAAQTCDFPCLTYILNKSNKGRLVRMICCI